VNQYQKGKTNLDFTEARDSEWQRHQMGHMQVCTLLQRDNPHQHTITLFFTGQKTLGDKNFFDSHRTWCSIKISMTRTT